MLKYKIVSRETLIFLHQTFGQLNSYHTIMGIGIGTGGISIFLCEDSSAYNDLCCTASFLDYEGPLNREGKRVFQTVKKKGDKQ
ncbi:MAG: hypothetical protein ACRCZU_09045, partial [Selenomonadaceae bacterium]